MKTAIRQRARELGFDDCRFTTAAAPDHTPQFQKWLADRQHGEMTWLERNADKRVDPQKVLPGARSVITLATSYARSDERRMTSDMTPSHAPRHPSLATRHSGGVVARYARFADYHDVLSEPLEIIDGICEPAWPQSTRSLWYVDTGPLLERDFAQRAGLGFVGKHTNLISRRLGNWIFLSEILTTLELEPDAPEKKSLWQLHALPRRLPDQCHHRAVHA